MSKSLNSDTKIEGKPSKERPLWQKILISIVTATMVGAIFLIYMVFIGIPKTTARNLYNEAEISQRQGDTTKAKELLEQAYTIWPEPYIQDKMETAN